MRRLYCVPLLLTILLNNVLETQAFQSAVLRTEIKTHARSRKSFSLIAPQTNNNDDGNEQDDDTDASEQLDGWLDKPFFDPMEYNEDDSTWQARLANFVKSDYDRFEFIYAGTFLVFMLVVSQELFRMQLYGADYVPFTSNSHTVNTLWKSM